MSKAELEATQKSGMLRGGRDGTHYVTDAANADALRARQRFALPQTPEVRVTMEVPANALSAPAQIGEKVYPLAVASPRLQRDGLGVDLTLLRGR